MFLQRDCCRELSFVIALLEGTCCRDELVGEQSDQLREAAEAKAKAAAEASESKSSA
jgi:hypothetical protein